MKKISIVLLVVLFVAFGYCQRSMAETQQALNIAYVDVAAVFDAYNKTKDQESLLASRGEQKQQEHNSMVESIRNMKTELELLKENQREKKQLAIDDQILKLQDFDRKTKRSLSTERDSMVRDILKEIDTVISEYAKQQGYTMVLNSRVLVYAQDTNDITKEIINMLNGRYKKN